MDPETGRPVETENARYQVSNPLIDLPLEEQIDVLRGMSAGEIEAAYHKPGPLGGHNWHPMTFSPTLGMYISLP